MQDAWAKEYNIISKTYLLKPIAGIAGYKQYISQKVANIILSSETIFDDISASVRNNLLIL